MPLLKTILIDPYTKIWIWNITESFLELKNNTTLRPDSADRLMGMKSELHQRGFLSVRKLLAAAGYTDLDLYYTPDGKPHLHDGRFVSITHSFEYAAISISSQYPVGIDIEKQRDKIQRIADKFVNETELKRLQNFSTAEYIRKLTLKWGAKEAIFKIENEKGISFKDHIQVEPFTLFETTGFAVLNFQNQTKRFQLYFEEVNDFSLVFAKYAKN